MEFQAIQLLQEREESREIHPNTFSQLLLISVFQFEKKEGKGCNVPARIKDP